MLHTITEWQRLKLHVLMDNLYDSDQPELADPLHDILKNLGKITPTPYSKTERSWWAA